MRTTQTFLRCRTIILHASAFMKVNEFCNEVNKRWNGGTFSVGGSVSRGILSEYMLHLKSDYYEQDDQKKFQVANVAGYMGSDYWFLSQGVRHRLNFFTIFTHTHCKILSL